MREKPVSEVTVDKYIDFLFNVQKLSDNAAQVTLRKLTELNNITAYAAVAIVKLGIIEKHKEKGSWTWKVGRPSKQMALQLLDFILHQRKKTIHTPIMPDWASIAKALDNVSEKLAVITVQNNNALKRLKIAPNQTGEKADLFRVDDQRLFIAGQIASGIYHSDFFNSLAEQHIQQANDYIVRATDDLITQLCSTSRQ